MNTLSPTQFATKIMKQEDLDIPGLTTATKGKLEEMSEDIDPITVGVPDIEGAK